MSTLTITRYVMLPGMAKELELNPSAKVFREIKIAITPQSVIFDLSTVTKTAAEGGYRNGSINNSTVEMPVATFMNASATADALGAEPWIVVDQISRLRLVLQGYMNDDIASLLGDLDKS